MDLSLCRLCYEKEASINIFYSYEGSISAKIKTCCRTLSIEENDSFPPLICKSCDVSLDNCYRFVLKCETADKKIRNFLLASSLPSGDLKEVYSPKAEVKTELDDLEDDFHDDHESLSYPLEELKPELEVKLEDKQEKINVQPRIKKQHKKRVKVNKNKLMCSNCGRKCLSSSALSIHMRSHTNERPYQCPSCNKSYKDAGTLKRHVDRNHLQNRERKFICENCGKRFYAKRDIQVHMRVHTGETPYSCPICPAHFTQMSAMLRHKRRHTDKKSHMCATCGKPFWTKEELKRHFSVHEDTRKFTCPICQVQFKHKGSIQKHMRVHAEPNRFICSDCGQTFNNKGNLKSHVERKHSEKSGRCDICLKNVSNIEVHMWRHNGQRPLKCEFCASSFYEMKALALHINFKHKKTDKFKCTSEGCTKSFPSKPMLLFHVAKFHEQQTPYPCGKCSRGFYRKNDLARHMLGTHKEKLP